MARKKTDTLQKHTLNLRAGDMEQLRALFPAQEPSVMVRKIVSGFIDRTLREAARQSRPTSPPPECDI